jgi:hypothetical protein
LDRAKILALLDVEKGRGLEIGPLMRPIVTKAMGRVEYIDRASTDELRRWYSNNDQVDPASLVEVDHVWGTQTLFECVGRQRVYDYVVASHVIEHVPDLFGWLQEIGSVLADGGIGSFVVPDKRYTFDVLRRTSSPSDLVDAYVRGLRRPDARQIFDHFINFRNVDAEALRSGDARPDVMPSQHEARELMEICRRAHGTGEYIDAHCWVFTPESFVEALDFGSRLDVLPFEIAAIFPTPDRSHEFFVSLRRLPEASTREERRSAFVASRERLVLPSEAERPANLDELKQRLAAAEGEIEALRRSTSWRLTAPLRRMATLWRRLRAG